MNDPAIIPPDLPPDEPEEPPPQLVELAKAMYGAYNHHSGGLRWNGDPCPSWSEIKLREHHDAGVAWNKTDPGYEIIPIEPDGVLAHWCYTAALAAPADDWEARTRWINSQHAQSDVYQRSVK